VITRTDRTIRALVRCRRARPRAHNAAGRPPCRAQIVATSPAAAATNGVEETA